MKARSPNRAPARSDEFLGEPARVVAELSARALTRNFAAIQALVPGQALLPMVKADGYGHGAEWVARCLLHLDGLYGFGVASLEEGGELRRQLGARGRRARIIVFSGALPWSDQKGEYCERFNLVPVIATEPDWRKFVRGGWPSHLAYELEFNTGMNRLGIGVALAAAIAKEIRKLGPDAQPMGVFSHLATAETSDARITGIQLEKFAWLRGELEPACPSARFHLANSAAIWNQKHYDLARLTDVVRPGLSLYGIAPWPDAPTRGIEPVLTLRASVLMVHRLGPGQVIGYGGTYQVKGDGPVHAAIIGAGYADGVSRTLSNQGHAWLGGRAERFLGVVSMDLSALSCTAAVKPGDWAELLGPHIDAWAQARAAQTIPYELLTSISARVQRIYE